jgi:hypothetical protein
MSDELRAILGALVAAVENEQPHCWTPDQEIDLGGNLSEVNCWDCPGCRTIIVLEAARAALGDSVSPPPPERTFTLEQVHEIAAIVDKAIDNYLAAEPPAVRPERCPTCPTCLSDDPTMRLMTTYNSDDGWTTP